MNISTNYSAQLVSSTSAVQPLATASTTTDSATQARPQEGHGHHHGHGGGMGKSVVAALQSLGINLPNSATGPTQGTGSASGGKDADGDHDGSTSSSTAAATTASGTSATSSTQQDFSKFMHALFSAVRQESTQADGTPSGASTDRSAGFANGLSALITQEANGNGPSELQDAFNKLVSDVQSSSGTATAGSGSPVDLKSFLSKLQESLGGTNTASAATGNLVSTQV